MQIQNEQPCKRTGCFLFFLSKIESLLEFRYVIKVLSDLNNLIAFLVIYRVNDNIKLKYLNIFSHYKFENHATSLRTSQKHKLKVHKTT